VDVHHPHTEPRGFGNRRGDGVGDVVILQIEKNTVTSLNERANDGGTFGGEEPAADFEAAGNTGERFGESERAFPVVDVERD
jgi:hypothetical protein